MFADGDFVAGGDHPAEVAVDGVERDAGHGDGVLGVEAAAGAAGEGDAEDFGGEFGVFPEHFVKIAHAEKEDVVWVLGFELVVLAHGGG